MKTTPRSLLLYFLYISLCVPNYGLLAQTGGKDTVIFSRIGPGPLGTGLVKKVSLSIANADGTGEHSLLGNPDVDYNPAWSESGDWIVFTSEREGSADLFRIQPDGSNLERLTDNPAYDDQAAISPDGKQVAFVSTRVDGTADLWTLDLETRQSQALTSGQGGDFRPAWSPDGNWIAFSSDRGQGFPFAPGRWEAMHLVDIYLIHPDGTGLRRITKPNGFCGSPKWAPDGTQIIAYCMSGPETLDYRGDRTEGAGITRIVSIDVNTGTETELSNAPGVKIAPVFIAPNKYAYISKGPDSKGIHYSDGTTGPQGVIRTAAWSPDGNQLVFDKVELINTPTQLINTSVWSRLDNFALKFSLGVQLATDPSSSRYAGSDYIPPPGVNQLYTVDAITNEITFLFHDDKRNVLGPQWSAQGDTLIFGLGTFGAFFAGFHDRILDSDDRINGGAQIAMINADGSGFKELITNSDNNAFPSPSPDGKSFVFRTFGTTGSGLRLYDMASSKTTTLTSEYDNFPLWSPRGDLIMFSRLYQGSYEIFTIRPDGSEEKQLTSSAGNDTHQGWSPDGEEIVFSSGRMGFKDEAIYTDSPQPYGEIFAMRYDGTNVRQLTDNQWEEGAPAWLRNTETTPPSN